MKAKLIKFAVVVIASALTIFAGINLGESQIAQGLCSFFKICAEQ